VRRVRPDGRPHPPQRTIRDRVLPHLAYNLGRVYTYALLGGLAGAFGGWIALSSRSVGIRAFVPVLAGVVTVALGLFRMGLVPPFGAVQALTAGPFTRLSRLLGGLVRGRTLSHRFAFGLFNGLLPCGLSCAVALTAAGAGGFVNGFLTMAVFGLGTLPALFVLGMSSAAVNGRLRGRLFRLAGLLVVALGLLSVARGVRLAGQPAPPDCCAPAP
jgi:sulfite exporter TauE/SafE